MRDQTGIADGGQLDAKIAHLLDDEGDVGGAAEQDQAVGAFVLDLEQLRAHVLVGWCVGCHRHRRHVELGERGLNALGGAEAVIVGHRHDAGLGLAERLHQIFGNEVGELAIMDMGSEQPLAALRRDLGIGGADQKRRFGFGHAFGLREHMRADHRSEDDQRLAFEDAVHGVERVGRGRAGIFRRQREFLAGDAAIGIDLIDREFDAIARLRAQQRQIACQCGGQAERDRRRATRSIGFRFNRCYR